MNFLAMKQAINKPLILLYIKAVNTRVGIIPREYLLSPRWDKGNLKQNLVWSCKKWQCCEHYPRSYWLINSGPIIMQKSWIMRYTEVAFPPPPPPPPRHSLSVTTSMGMWRCCTAIILLPVGEKRLMCTLIDCELIRDKVNKCIVRDCALPVSYRRRAFSRARCDNKNWRRRTGYVHKQVGCYTGAEFLKFGDNEGLK